jgi:hypothetical protein
MGIEVVVADPTSVMLRAPFAPNINHRETVFGGSASAVTILAAWALLYVRLQQGTVEKCRQRRSHFSEGSTYPPVYASPSSLLAALLDGLFEQSLLPFVVLK